MTDPKRADLLQQAIRLKKAAARSRTPDLPPRPADQAAHLGELRDTLRPGGELVPISPSARASSRAISSEAFGSHTRWTVAHRHTTSLVRSAFAVRWMV